MKTYLIPSASTNSTSVGIVSVSATSLPAGSPPTVINLGTSTAASLVFGIPAGAIGPTGPAGSSGTAGLGGTSYTVASQSITANNTLNLFPLGPNGFLSGTVLAIIPVAAGNLLAQFSVQIGPAGQFQLVGILNNNTISGVSLTAPIFVASGNLVITVSGGAIIMTGTGTAQLVGSTY